MLEELTGSSSLKKISISRSILPTKHTGQEGFGVNLYHSAIEKVFIDSLSFFFFFEEGAFVCVGFFFFFVCFVVGVASYALEVEYCRVSNGNVAFVGVKLYGYL